MTRADGEPSLSDVEDTLRELHAGYQPGPGWQLRVLETVRAQPARRAWRWWFAVAPALAAAALALWWWRARPAPELAPQLAVLVERSAEPVRGQSMRVGDSLRLAASGGPGHRALWVYRGAAELLLACPQSPACSSVAEGLTVKLELTQVGQYTVIALWSPRQLPAPIGSLDTELAAALRAEAVVERRVLVVD